LIRSFARLSNPVLCASLSLAIGVVLAGCSEKPAATSPDSGDAESAAMGAVPKMKGEIETPSGLRITELVPGTGASPKPTDVVVVHYHGTFPDGTVFDSSVDRGQPARFPLNRVIPCWTEGLQRMKTGGKSRLVCPPGIAYGARGAPPRIPGNATLVFEVELLSIGQ